MKNKKLIGEVSSFMPVYDKPEDLRVTSTPFAFIHEIPFYTPFEDPLSVVELVSTLRNAEDNDMILLRINSPGGRVDTLSSVLSGIELTKGKVVAYAEGDVYSAAAVMFCACDGWQVSPGASFLFHNGTLCDYGKPNDILDHVEHQQKRMDILLDMYCSKFLTKKEIKSIKNGRELFLTSKEMTERIDKHLKEQDEE